MIVNYITLIREVKKQKVIKIRDIYPWGAELTFAFFTEQNDGIVFSKRITSKRMIWNNADDKLFEIDTMKGGDTK